MSCVMSRSTLRSSDEAYLEITSPNSNGSFASDSFSPSEVDSPDSLVERTGEGAECSVERLAGVGVGERSGTERMGEESEVGKP